MRNPHVPPGFWRGVNINQNAIYLECFIDELAHAAGQDPLEFRRKLMAKHPKHLAVLNAVAEKIGWGKPAPQGVYRGIAQHMGFGSYVAAAPKSRSTDGSKIKIHRIVAATDSGHAVNPEQIEPQIEGSFVYGLSGAVLWRMHGQGRPHRAGELRHLRLDADGRDAEGRDHHYAVAAASGAASASRPSRCRAGGAQRHLRGDRQADPFVAAEGPEHSIRLIDHRCGSGNARRTYRVFGKEYRRMRTPIAAVALSLALAAPAAAQSAVARPAHPHAPACHDAKIASPSVPPLKGAARQPRS